MQIMYVMEKYYTYILDIIAFHTFMKTIYFGMSLLQSGYPTFISLSQKKNVNSHRQLGLLKKVKRNNNHRLTNDQNEIRPICKLCLHQVGVLSKI